MAGYTVSWSDDGLPYLHNALPLDYLERMLRQNAVFGDDVRLAGVWNPQGYDWRIVTTQPDVASNKATLSELEASFLSVGFELLPWRGIGYAESLAFRKEGVDIWNVHPANVLIGGDRLPIPFDVMLTPSPAAEQSTRPVTPS